MSTDKSERSKSGFKIVDRVFLLVGAFLTATCGIVMGLQAPTWAVVAVPSAVLLGAAACLPLGLWWRRGLLALGFLFATLVAFSTVAFWVPRQETVIAYSGSCGRFRICDRRYGGLKTRCWLASSRHYRESAGYKSFGDEASCESDWHVVFTDTHSLMMTSHGGGPRQAPSQAINMLDAFHFNQSGFREQFGKFLAGADQLDFPPRDYTPYALGECAGKKSFLTEHAYQVVLVGNLDSDPDLDCWVLTSDDELRHLQRD